MAAPARWGLLRSQDSQMPWIILVHCALIGIAPIIPVVYLDDWAVAYFNRRLVLALAKLRGAALSPAEVALLADMQDYGCLGALTGRAAYTLFRRATREVASEFSIALEIQRGVDLFAQAYTYAHLLDYALQQGLYHPGEVQRAAQVRAAIRSVRKGANLTLVKRAASAAFDQSRHLLRESLRISLRLAKSASGRAGRGLRTILAHNYALRLFFPRLVHRWQESPAATPSAEDIAAAAQKDPTFIDLVKHLQTSLNAVPQEHFHDLEDRLTKELE